MFSVCFSSFKWFGIASDSVNRLVWKNTETKNILDLHILEKENWCFSAQHVRIYNKIFFDPARKAVHAFRTCRLLSLVATLVQFVFYQIIFHIEICVNLVFNMKYLPIKRWQSSATILAGSAYRLISYRLLYYPTCFEGVSGFGFFIRHRTSNSTLSFWPRCWDIVECKRRNHIWYYYK